MRYSHENSAAESEHPELVPSAELAQGTESGSGGQSFKWAVSTGKRAERNGNETRV